MKNHGIRALAALAITLAVAWGGAWPDIQSAQAAGDQEAADRAAIEETANLYLRSGQLGNVEMLRQAFHPSARLQFVKNGEYVEWAGTDYISWRKPGKTSDYEARILMIDSAGDAAIAKVELDYGSHCFQDYLSLLRIDGRWWVVNKVFHREEG